MKLNNINKNPENLSRVLINFSDNILEFAFYKDGMFEMDGEWYSPNQIKGWISIKDLKKILDIQ